MRGLLSLDQELRAIRKGRDQDSAPRSNRQAGPKETERPWQPEVDQLQHTMREVLRAVAGFSGVELPGLPSEAQGDETLSPSLNLKTLKDRFRNDLEGFSLKTTQELAKRAREQARAALEAVQNEVGGMVDQVAAEFREDLQLPAQIEKLLEPCVEDAETRLASSISQKFDDLVARHEQLVQEKIQATLSSVHAQMSELEQTVQQIRDLKAQSAAQPSSQQPSAADIEQLLVGHERSVQSRLHEALAPVQTQIGTLEQTVQQLRELRVDSASQPSTAEVASRIDELAVEFREKLHDQTKIEKLFEPRIEEAAARLEKSISQKFENLVAQHEQLVQQKLEGTASSVQAQIRTLEQAVQDVRSLKAELVAQASAKHGEAAADVERLLAEHDRLAQSRLHEALSPFKSQISTLEQAVQQVRELKSEPVVQPPADRPSTAEIASRIDQLSAEFEEKLQGLGQIEKSFEPRVQEAAGRLEKSISQRVEHLVTRHEKLVQEKLQGTVDSLHGQMSTLEETVQQILDLRAGPVAHLQVAQPVDAAGKNENGLNLDLNGFLDQAFSRIECSFNDLREARKKQAAQNSNTTLEYLRQAIPTGSPDMLIRVQQALDNLDRLGSKEPAPAS